MALTPTPSTDISKDKAATRRDAEQEMLMREVDEAVRQDEVTSFARTYAWPLGIGFVFAILAFGGYLMWRDSTENRLEQQSEELVQAIDELEAGNVDAADEELALLADGEGGAATSAAMLRAGIAAEAGRAEDAVALYDRVANDEEVPQAMRDIAAIRSVALQFDDLDPQQVIDRIGPLAVPGNAFYGSAGELVAHAYLAQNKQDQAGPLLVAIAQDETVPDSIRGRTQQLAGLLGFDAIEDVDETLARITGEEPSGASVELVE